MYLIVGLILIVISLIIYLKKRNMKEGVIIEKKNLPTSRFMAFQYKVKIENNGESKIIETPVLMTDKEVGDKIRF